MLQMINKKIADLKFLTPEKMPFLDSCNFLKSETATLEFYIYIVNMLLAFYTN
jgi:hypothetical protein